MIRNTWPQTRNRYGRQLEPIRGGGKRSAGEMLKCSSSAHTTWNVWHGMFACLVRPARLQTTSAPFQKRSVDTVQDSVHSVVVFGSFCVFISDGQRLCPCLLSLPLRNCLQFAHSILLWKLLLFSRLSCAWLPVLLSANGRGSEVTSNTLTARRVSRSQEEENKLPEKFQFNCCCLQLNCLFWSKVLIYDEIIQCRKSVCSLSAGSAAQLGDWQHKQTNV